MTAETKSHGAIPAPVRALIVTLFLTSFSALATITILGKQVFDMTGRELDLGLLGLFEFLPILMLAPIAGSVADRYDRRFVYAFGVAGEIAAALGLFLYVRTDPTAVWPIFALMALFGAARAFVAPSSRSLPIDLAPPEVLERVIAIRSIAFQLGAITGPVAAGFVFLLGPEWPYLMVAGAYVVAVCVMFFIPNSGVDRLELDPSPAAAWRQAFDGIRFIRNNRVVLGAITLDLFAVLLGGAVALLPAIDEKRLGVGAVGLGWLRAAVGIGSFMMASYISVRPIRRKVGKVLLAAVSVFGLATIVLGLTRSFTVAFIALLTLSAADAISVFVRATVVPLATPENMRGRVLAVENLFIGASNELGAVESGIAASLLGLVGAVVAGGVGTLCVVGWFWTQFTELRDIDYFADAKPDG